MKRAIVTCVAVALALTAVYLLLPVQKSSSIDAKDAFVDAPKNQKIAAAGSGELHDSGSAPAQTEAVVSLPSSIPEIRARIRFLADTKYFPYSVLTAILNGPFPHDIKFMALQAFTQVHYMKSDEVYKNTPALLDFLEKNLQDLRENENYRGVSMMLVDQLNDDSNPNQKAALEYFEAKFQEFRLSDKELAKVFLRGFKDQDLVKEIINDKTDPVLSDAARNVLPQIATPMVVKEIIQDNRFTPDQQSVALQRLASNVDGEVRPNGMTDAEALIVLAKDLDRKRETGDKYLKAVLYGISGSKHKDRERFLVDGMKKSLEPYRAKKGTLAYSSIPELSAMFGYLMELPDQSSVYGYFMDEMTRMASESECPGTQADRALLDLISFWQDSCEKSIDDCPEKSKVNASYKSISDKYITLKNRCPLI